MTLSRAVGVITLALLCVPLAASASGVPSCVMSSPPRSVAPGSSTRLIWTTQNATAASISGIASTPVNAQLPQGYRDVTVSRTTMFTMTVWNGSVSRTCSALVTVTPAVQITAPSTVWYGSIYTTPMYTTPVYTARSPVVIQAPTAYPTNTVYVSNGASAYVNIPDDVPVYNTYSEPGFDYDYTPYGYDAPVPGQPFINVDSFQDQDTGMIIENHYGCYEGWGGFATCDPEPMATYGPGQDESEQAVPTFVDPQYPSEEEESEQVVPQFVDPQYPAGEEDQGSFFWQEPDFGTPDYSEPDQSWPPYYPEPSGPLYNI